MNHAQKIDPSCAASNQKTTAKPTPNITNLDAVIEIVKGYKRACEKEFAPHYCNTLAERRNTNNTVNAMVQACISLHIAMLPAAPATCCPTPAIDALSNERIQAGAQA
ncbi:MAG: hypothetical protein WCG50_14370 [Rhodoferax sp.]|uniref:hypothetical protein n=1 Tax=Rhodoferax sp. TaxID=50421 RepID=UPI003018040D